MRRRFWFHPILGLLVILVGLVLPYSAGQIHGELKGQSATLLPDGRLLLIGGEGPQGPLTAAAILNTQSGQLTPLATGIYHARAWHTATLLPNGTVLVFGGIGISGQEVGAEIFDPVTDTTLTIQTIELRPRVYHTATLLSDGRVLIAGGRSQSGGLLDSIALWDYRSNSAIEHAAALIAPREKHTSTLLPDGSVLLWGGNDAAGMILDFGERFDPVSERTTLQRWPASAEEPEPLLALAASLPPDGTGDVQTNAIVALRFSIPLSVVTANSQTVTLAGPEGPVPSMVVPAEGGILVFVSPRTALLPATTYTVSMSGLAAGSSQMPDTSISFSTTGSPLGVRQPGIGREGTFEENVGEMVTSAWSSLPAVQAAAGITAVSGQVLRLNGLPLPNVSFTMAGQSITSDESGRFLLTAVPAGHQVILIDGRTASTSAATFGVFEVEVEVVPGKTNILPYKIWMPKLDTAHVVTISFPTKKETVITNPGMPGLELHLPSSAVVHDHQGKVVTQVGITPIPLGRPPFPLPAGVAVPIYFTVQPGAGYIQVQDPKQPQGGWLVYPNTYHSPPATRYDFWNYDPDQEGWYIYGHGTVTPNGAQIAPDPGVLIYELTGAMVASPSLAPSIGPAPGGCGGIDGDPVDCGTGLFVWQKTDLFLPDVIPITLTRTYRPNDFKSRAFGIGTTQLYDMFLVGDTNPFTFADLILPDGGKVHYKRTSAGTGYIDAVYQHTSTPTIFYGSTITLDVREVAGRLAWDLRLKDGTVLVFGAAAASVPGQVALLEIRDRHGNVLQLSRDSSFNLTTITSPNGRWVQLTYDTSNRVTQAIDNAGRTVGYTYDSAGRLSIVKDPNGGLVAYTYDTHDRMLSVKNARGVIQVTNQYDSKGRVVQQTLANGGTYHFNYILNTGGSIIETEVTNPLGVVRKITFNSSGYMLTDTRALGRPEQQTITNRWQANTNLLLGVTDALGRQNAYEYDASGNVTSLTRLAGTSHEVSTTFTYDPQFNQVTSVTDALGHTTTFVYDERGDLTSIADPLSHEWQLVRNGAGQLLAFTDPLGNTMRFTFAGGDLVGVTDPLGHTLTRVIDGAGRLIASSDPLQNTTQYSYDSLNRLVKILDPLRGITKFSYDPDGDLLSVADPANHVTLYSYDSMDRLMSRTDALSRKESYQRDSLGNLTEFTDRRGIAGQFHYDGLNRKISATFGHESTITYGYDQGNRLTKAVDSVAGAITRTYDELDGLTSATTPQGTVTYTRNALGQRTSMTAAGQAGITYTYDAANRLTRISQGSANVDYTYDAANRRTTMTLPNGVTATYTLDRASELTSLRYTHGTTIIRDLTYTYDEAGRRTNVGGNLFGSELPPAIGSASYDASNELTRLDTVKLAYDPDGNLTSDGINTYTWNARGQLVQVSIGGRPFATFQYDAFGRRLGKDVSGLATQFLYDGPNVVEEIASTTAHLLTGLSVDEIFGRTDTTGSSTFLTDALGSTVALTDLNGNIQTQYAYAPFGDTTVSGSSSTNSFEFTGRENDGTGLYYYRARYYSPTLGRFTSEDRLGFASGSTNSYAYNGDNPITFVDPFGMMLFPPGWLDNPENVAFLLKAAGQDMSPLASSVAPAAPGTGASPLATTGVDPFAGTAVDPLADTIPELAANASPLATEVTAPEAIAGTASGLGSNITFLGLNYSQFAPQVEAARAAQAAATSEGAAASVGVGSAFGAGVAVGAAIVASLWAAYTFYSAACVLH